MSQNDEALYYGKPHLHYITPKTLVIIGVVSIYVKVIILFFCWLQISSGVAPLSRIAIGFTLLFACNGAVGGSVVIITYHCKISRQSSFVLPFVNRSNDDK